MYVNIYNMYINMYINIYIYGKFYTIVRFYIIFMDIFGTHMLPPLLWDDLLGRLWLTKNFPVDLDAKVLSSGEITRNFDTNTGWGPPVIPSGYVKIAMENGHL